MLIVAEPGAEPTASTRCASASAPASTTRTMRRSRQRFGFPLIEAWAMTETGAGGVIMANREPRHVGTHCFGRDRAVRRGAPRRRRRPRRGGTASRASCWCVRPGPTRAAISSAGYLKDAAGDRGGLGRRLVPHRRRGPARRRRQLLLRRPQEERDPAQRREHLRGRGRERAQPASRGEGVRRWPRRPTRCAATRCWPASSRASRCPTAGARAARGAASSQHALSQLAYFKAPGYVAFVDELPLTAVAEDPARRAARAGAGAAGAGPLHRHPVAQAPGTGAMRPRAPRRGVWYYLR